MWSTIAIVCTECETPLIFEYARSKNPFRPAEEMSLVKLHIVDLDLEIQCI